MSGVAAGEFLFHLRIAELPEVGNVLGHLPGAVVWGEDMDDEVDAAIGDGGGLVGADELHKFGGEERVVYGMVGDFRSMAAGEADALWAMAVEQVALVRAEPVVKDGPDGRFLDFLIGNGSVADL